MRPATAAEAAEGNGIRRLEPIMPEENHNTTPRPKAKKAAPKKAGEPGGAAPEPKPEPEPRFLAGRKTGDGHVPAGAGDCLFHTRKEAQAYLRDNRATLPRAPKGDDVFEVVEVG